MSIRSRRTSHLLMMSRHALPCRLTDLPLTRSSPCGSKWLVCVCVFHTTSKHFSRSIESRYVYLLQSHVAHAHDVISCLCPSSNYVGVLQAPVMQSKMAVLRVQFDLSKHFSRSAESRYVYLLPLHVAHSHHLMSCVSPARPDVDV